MIHTSHPHLPRSEKAVTARAAIRGPLPTARPAIREPLPTARVAIRGPLPIARAAIREPLPTARVAIRFVFLLAALISPSACGVSETACEDFSAAILGASARCGNKVLIEEVVNQMMKCPLAKGIWDEDQLRDECFPALETLDCGLLDFLQLPDACQDQLIYFP